MKLYLSSHKIGTRTEIMRDWIINHGNKILIVADAKDHYTDLERVESGTQYDINELQEIGFDVERLDLRSYFGKKDELEQIFCKVKSFYVTGGNTFVLRKAMKLSGFDELLLKYANDPDYFYSGYSAGICLLSKDMSGVAIMDEPEVDPYNSGIAPIYQGIGFIEEAIIPHFESDHKETQAASNAVRFCIEKNVPYIAIKDGDVIIREISNFQINLYHKKLD